MQIVSWIVKILEDVTDSWIHGFASQTLFRGSDKMGRHCYCISFIHEVLVKHNRCCCCCCY